MKDFLYVSIQILLFCSLLKLSSLVHQSWLLWHYAMVSGTDLCLTLHVSQLVFIYLFIRHFPFYQLFVSKTSEPSCCSSDKMGSFFFKQKTAESHLVNIILLSETHESWYLLILKGIEIKNENSKKANLSRMMEWRGQNNEQLATLTCPPNFKSR